MTVQRLIPYKKNFTEQDTSLQWLPIVYITASGAQALLLEGYVHAFMSLYESYMRHSIGSDVGSTQANEIYTRDAADQLLHVLHTASQKSVAQPAAGRNALRRLKRVDPKVIGTKEELIQRLIRSLRDLEA